mgnify:CR=1 FL=1
MINLSVSRHSAEMSQSYFLWEFNLFFFILISIAFFLYFYGVYRINTNSKIPKWSAFKILSFISALIIFLIADFGPIGVLDGVYFWAHMVQHILVMMIVAPLIILSSPVLLLVRVSSQKFRKQYIRPVLNSSIVKWITNPIFTWIFFVSVLLGTHFTPFYNFALENSWVHLYIEHPLYLTAALLYFYPLLEGNPQPHKVSYSWRIISLFTMMVPETMTGFFIYASTSVRYPHYENVIRPFGGDALSDQRLGGSLMWALSMVIDSIWLAVAVSDWFKSEERKSIRIDQEIARQTK